MKTKGLFKSILFIILTSTLIFVVGFSRPKNTTPQTVYQVYLDGETIGLINNKDELYNLINSDQKELKEKYGVEQVYPPEGLTVTKYITYDEVINSTSEIYEIIKDKSPFTISGYVVTITKTDEETGEIDEEQTKHINIINKEILSEALKSIVNVFVGETKYKKYIDNNQDEIIDVGSIIENIYFEEKLTIRESLIDTSKEIFVDQESLTQYLLFQTTEPSSTYTVRSGDDIETISFDHKLSVEEFLIANQNINSSTQLLNIGEKVNISLIKPILTLVLEEHVVEDLEVDYDTVIKYDYSIVAGYSKVTQEGENGVTRVTAKAKYINGEAEPIIKVSQTEIKPAIDRIITRGGTSGTAIYGDSENWLWPTRKPYKITSGFGWRWGVMHAAVDISGTGFRSPIYAAQAGIVHSAAWSTGGGGNRIIINHNNGYYTLYAHLDGYAVSTGEAVVAGQIIGYMGRTGEATGTHLHYSIYYGGAPYTRKSVALNPLTVYKKIS